MKSKISLKWRTLILLSVAELMGMAVWFSASAVVPELTNLWGLGDSGRAWLTMSVQIGFVVGAFSSAIFNLADRIPARWLFATTAMLAGASTILIPLAASGVGTAIVLRFLTGMWLAGVYPVGMKIMATWTKEDRGLGIGLLVGALTLGSASPHLINAFGGIRDWQFVMYSTGILAVIGGLIAALFIAEGPYKTQSPPFNYRYVGQILRDRDVMLANLGYLGHMWELFAMWSWIALFLRASFERTGVSVSSAAFWAFAAIGIGGVGSFMAGKLADKYGRTRITIWAMAISGACALTIGPFFGGNSAILVAITLVWGFTIVADSAQFSAAISELAEKEYVGTALTLQTSLGFLLTLVTIRLIPTLESVVGWQWAFTFLVFGPITGIWAMYTLQKSPGAARLAGGRG